MKVKLEDYRGFEMNFDIDDEVFYCMSSSSDTETTKKSYAALKKWVDDFIKENAQFKPIRLVRFNTKFKDGGEIVLDGCRKDGRFTFKDKSGKTQQLSEYNETDWFLPNEANAPILKQIDELDNQIRALENKRKELDDSLMKVTFKSVREQYLPK